MGFKSSQAEQKSRKASGYQDFENRDIESPEDRRSGISMVKTMKHIRVIHWLGHVAEIGSRWHFRVRNFGDQRNKMPGHFSI
jgi:tRNA (Thr-GGU) A37 N-methylase